MKKIKTLQLIRVTILICISLLNISSSRAQAIHYSIGVPGTNQVGDFIRTLPDGSNIIAGYTYSGSTITDADMILMKVKNGNVIWAEKWGNPGGNDFVQDMIITSAGDVNGDIVLVSAEHVPASSAYTISGLYRFSSATGAIVWQNRCYGYNGSTGGWDSTFNFTGDAILKSVCELTPGGNIVVAGYLKTPGGLTRALVSTYDNQLNYIYHDIFRNSTNPISNSHSHMFTGVVPNLSDTSSNPSVLLCGGDFDGAVNKAMLVSYIPPVTHTFGHLNWYKLFNIHDGTKGNSLFTQIFYAYKDPGAIHSNDRIMLSGKLSDDYFGTTNSEQFTFSSDPTGLGSISVHRLANGNTFTNTSRIYPYSYNPVNGDYNLYTSQNPNAIINDPVLNGDAAVLNGVITNISSLNSGVTSFSRSSSYTSGMHISILDTKREYSEGQSVGTIENYNFSGNNYIYYSLFNPIYNKSTNTNPHPCTYNDSSLTISALVVPGASTLSFLEDKFWNTQLPNLTPIKISPKIDSCGTRPETNPCDNVGTATLSINATLGHASSCGFSAVMNVSLNPGWTVTSYSIFGSCYPGISVLSSSTTFIRSFTIASGSACTITVIANLRDSAGDICTITKSEYVSCSNGVGTVTGSTCGTVSISQMGTSYINGNCGYGFTAFVTPDPGWSVVQYIWSSGTYSITHVSSATSDAYPSFILSPGTSRAVSVTVLLTDGNGNYCTIIQSSTASCPGCGTILINPVGTVTAWGCSIATSAAVTPDPGWHVVDYNWNGPAGQYIDPASQQQPNIDVYQNFTLQPGAVASVSVTAHLSDGYANDCYLTATAPSVGCPVNCGNSVQLTPSISPDPSGCNVSTSAVVSPDPNYIVVDYNWNGPAGAYTDVISSSQDTYQSFILQPGSSALVSVSVDLTDVYGYGDICTISQSVIPTCASNKQTHNAGFNNNQLSKSAITIYPNPTEGAINVSSAESNISTVEVYDITGKKLEIYQFNNAKEAHISIGEYAAGSYIINVNNSIKQIVNKVK